MRRTVIVLLSLLLVVGLGAPAGAGVGALPPVPVEGLFTGSPPDVTADSWILYDDTFDRVLADQDPDTPRAMASTTKMMTALVALERAGLAELVTVDQEATSIGEAEIDLVPGEVWRIDDLIRAMLLESANDAAVAVSRHVGGTVEAFVELMNDAAEELGLENTRFANPHGLDAPDHYSSARDLVDLARAAMEHPQFASIVGSRTAILPEGPQGQERVAQTTNQLLYDYPGAIGVKTGFTDDAGWTLVAAAERDGRRLYVAVLGSPTSQERFADAAALLDYGFTQFGIIEVVVAGTTYARRRLPDDAEDATAADSFSVFANRDQSERITLVPGYELGRPVVIAELEGTELARIPLEARDSPELPSLRDAFAWASRYWDWLFGNE